MGTKEKLTKPTTRREPKAATLYGHLRGYISSHDIGEDAVAVSLLPGDFDYGCAQPRPAGDIFAHSRHIIGLLTAKFVH